MASTSPQPEQTVVQLHNAMLHGNLTCTTLVQVRCGKSSIIRRTLTDLLRQGRMCKRRSISDL